MEKIITIKRLNCPVCGKPMIISDVRRHNNPMQYYYDGIQEMQGVEVVYICTNDEHAIKTEVEIYRGYIEDAEE